jgi:AbiV family abortive infection protein
MSLAILAIEELGKALLVAEASSLLDGDQNGWKKFKAEFASHRSELATYPKLATFEGIVVFARMWLRGVSLQDLGIDDSLDLPFFRDYQRFACYAIDMGSPDMNTLKQRGFYVDLPEESFIDPDAIPQGMADACLRIARHGLNRAQRIGEKRPAQLALEIARMRAERDANPEMATEAVENLVQQYEHAMREAVANTQLSVPSELETELREWRAKELSRMVSIFGLACAI